MVHASLPAITIDRIPNGRVSIIHKIIKQSTLVKYKKGRLILSFVFLCEWREINACGCSDVNLHSTVSNSSVDAFFKLAVTSALWLDNKKSLCFLELLFHTHSSLSNSAREAENNCATKSDSKTCFTQLCKLFDWRHWQSGDGNSDGRMMLIKRENLCPIFLYGIYPLKCDCGIILARQRKIQHCLC